MWCARPITRCSVCWSGAGWRLNELGKDNGDMFYSSFPLVYVLVMGTCVQGWCCYISETVTSLQHFHLGLFAARAINFSSFFAYTSPRKPKRIRFILAQ
jgi:hypothetical protein